ncbi:hypothetical protein KEM54_004903, partial [Ascosphaera aggregata]
VDLPKLKSVSGDFNLQSTNNVGCDKIKKDISDNVEGQITCKERVSDPKTSKDGSASKTSSSSSEPTETDNAASSSNNAAAAKLGLVAAIIGAMV